MKKTKQKLFIILFLLPSVVLFILFFATPIIEVIFTSFCEWSLVTKPVFIGINNYKELFTNNSDFIDALRHTFIWTIMTVGIQVPFAILVALVLMKKPIGWKFARNSFVIPNIISTAAIGMIFMNMLDSDFGVINAIIRKFIPGFDIAWLQDDRTAFFAVSLSWIFYAGQNVLLLMAEISSVSDSILEAARIDGANSLQTDLYVVIPMLRNIIGTVSILVSSFAITEFSEVYILTRGGPGTETLNLGVYLFKTAMLENNYGIANTVGVVQLIMGLIAVVTITKVFKLGKSY